MMKFFTKPERIMFAENYGLIRCQMVSKRHGKEYSTAVRILKRNGNKYHQIGEIPIEHCTDMQQAMHRTFKQASIALQRE